MLCALRNITSRKVKRRYHHRKTTTTAKAAVKVVRAMHNDCTETLSCPFGDLATSLSDSELRETAYEIVVGACLNVSESEKAAPTPHTSLTSRAASTVKKALGLRSRRKKSSGNKPGSDRVKKVSSIEETLRVRLRVSEQMDSRVRKALSKVAANQAGTGIAELIALEMSKQTKIPLEETRKKIWLVDSKGLIVNSRKDSLQHFKKPWAHDYEPVKDLLGAVKAIKPTVLIGSSGVGRTFTKEIIETITSLNEKPLIMALSNPTSQSECTAQEAYTWSQGCAIFASGSPFDPFEYKGKIFVPGQANNAYIFPGFGLGLAISGAIRVHDDMLLAASEALAKQVTKENYAKGLIYPPFSNIRKISATIAANVAAKAYELGVATRLPRPANLVKYAESCMYSPVYRSYR